MQQKFKFVIWLTGNSGAGKTTTAYNFQKNIDCIILDGDEMRSSISLGAGFSKEEREEHNLRVARLAEVLRKQGHLIVIAVIAPFENTRKKLEEITPIKWVYIKRTLPKKLDRPYEAPKNPDVVIDIDELNPIFATNKLFSAFKTWT